MGTQKADASGLAPIILLVDHEGEVRDRIAELLTVQVQAQVIAVASGQDALEQLGLLERRLSARAAAKLAAVAMVISELDLPDLSALELCRRIRLTARVRELPFIVLSALGEEQVLASAFEAGASEFLCKPVRPVELVVRVRAALRTSRARTRSDEKVKRLAGVARRLQRVTQDLQSMVCVDALTALANHHHVETILRSTWNQALRSGRCTAVLLVDIDGFHAYNEAHGHLTGDDCLKRIAKALALALRRPGDLAGRWGGEEFVAVLPETDSNGAQVIGERLRAAVEHLRLPHGAPGWGPVVTVSVGYAAAVPSAQSGPEELLAEADAALYRAKAAGRNQVAGDATATGPRRVSGTTGAQRPDPVIVDPSMAEPLRAVLAARVDDLRAMDTVVAQRDFDRLRFMARELRALARRHGFATAELAARLDDAAASHSMHEVKAIVDELRWYLENVPVIYRRITSKMLKR